MGEQDGKEISLRIISGKVHIRIATHTHKYSFKQIDIAPIHFYFTGNSKENNRTNTYAERLR
jgi:hypothetical protein